MNSIQCHLWLAVFTLLLAISGIGQAFFKGGLSSSGGHQNSGHKVLIDPGLALFPTTGKIHSGPIVLTNVRVVGYARPAHNSGGSVNGGFGNGGGGGNNGGGNGGIGQSIAGGVSDLVGGISNGVTQVVQKGSNVVESVAKGVGDLVDDKLRSLNDKLEPIREKVGELMNAGGGVGGGSQGNGGFAGGFGGGLSEKINGLFGGSSLNHGGPMPNGYGNRIVYVARVRNNRNAVHPHHSVKKQIGSSHGNSPRWVKSNCPGVYVGVGFTPDPCPNQIPPCNGGCGGNNARHQSSGGWA